MGNPTPPFDDDEFLRGLPRQGDARVVGPVKLQARISKGGMGVVYRGRHLKLDIDVAVKFLLPHLVQNNPEYLLRFEREARFAAQLNNENLVRVFDVDSEDNYHYVVMELVCGETARDRVARKGPLAEAEAMAIILGATRGLEAAHRKSIVHRDIKPENIMIDASGIVKLADLGIAKVQNDPERTQSVVTQPGAIIGTPAFMAPEQVQSAHAVGPEVDIYSMGATLYFLLTGKVPFEGTLLQVLHAIGSRGFPDVRKERPGLSEKVLRILNCCTALDPAARYPDAGALLRDIDRNAAPTTSLAEAGMGTVHAEARVSTPPRQHLGGIRLAVAENERSAPSTALFGRGRRASLVAAAAIILCGAFAAGGYFAFREVANPRQGEAMARAPAGNGTPGVGGSAAAGAAGPEKVPERPSSQSDAGESAAPSTTVEEEQRLATSPEPGEAPADELTPLEEPESSIPAGREAAPATEGGKGEESAESATTVVAAPPPAEPAASPADSASVETPAPAPPAPPPDPVAVAEAVPPAAEPASEPAVEPASEPAADLAWADELASSFQVEGAQAAGLPVAREIKLGGDVVLRFLYIPPGEFQRGGPAAAAAAKVTLTKGFYLGVHEVTWDVFLAVAGGASRSAAAGSGEDAGKLPVTIVSWDEARRFCGALTDMVSAKGARARFRLPTEAEWEHACRAGSTAAYPWGDGFEEAYAWCWINSEGRPHPAGLRRPNAWGLFDTLGNAAEWCADWHAPHPAGDAVDPSGPQTGTARVVRGGSWKDLKGQLKPALRRSLPPGQFDKETGFRLAMDP